MANVNFTSREFYNAIIEGNVTNEVIEYAREQLTKLDEKNEKRRNRLSKNQKSNEDIKTALLAVLENDKVYLASEVVGLVDGITSTQKASALLRQLVESGNLTCEEVKITGKGKVKGYKVIVTE